MSNIIYNRNYLLTRTLIVGVFLCLFLSISISDAQAQQQQLSSCPAIVEQALEAVGNGCGDLNRDMACYGNNRLETTFSPSATDITFEEVGDRTNIPLIQRLVASPLDQLLNEWGVSVLNIQANIPDTLPGQAVIFLLLGNSILDNNINPDTELEHSNQTIMVQTSEETDLHALAELGDNILATIPPDTQLFADGISEDGLWLRVNYMEQIGWLMIPQRDNCCR